MDRIGPNTFIRLSRAPERVTTRWDVLARAGVNGVALWAVGVCGEPFVVEAEAVATNFVVGRSLMLEYKLLEAQGPVPVWFGIQEPSHLYKVLKVEFAGPGVKAVPRAHVANDSTWYTALVFSRWELLPIDPGVQRP
jgi:hypothetical protein